MYFAISLIPDILSKYWKLSDNKIKEIMDNFELVSWSIKFHYFGYESDFYEMGWNASACSYTIKVFGKTKSHMTNYVWADQDYSDKAFAETIATSIAGNIIRLITENK